MEHKITIEIILKSDLFDSEKQEDNSKPQSFNFDPKMLNPLFQTMVENLAKGFPKEEPEEKKKEESKKTKPKKEVKK